MHLPAVPRRRVPRLPRAAVMGRPTDDPNARYVIKYKPTRSWFYTVPTATVRVTGDQARRETTRAIRDGGGSVVQTRRVGWFGW